AKLALTFWLSPAGTKVQLVVLDTHAPPKATKCEPTAGAARRMTGLPSNIGSEQSVPQLMPVEGTVPLPAPPLATVTSVRARKFGIAVVLPLSTKAQVGLVAPPAQVTPVQFTKTKPGLAAACSATAVP